MFSMWGKLKLVGGQLHQLKRRRAFGNIYVKSVGVGISCLACCMLSAPNAHTDSNDIGGGGVDANSIHTANNNLDKIDSYSNMNLSNWSNTYTSKHLTACRRWEPKNTAELFEVMKHCSQHGRKIRPIGSALSPNAIGFPSVHGDVLSLINFDHIRVNPAGTTAAGAGGCATVTVGAGVTVSDLLHELQGHGLTLENFSSIKEQQVAGWTQVAAHGTGAGTSTVDDMIVSMKIAAFDTLPLMGGHEGVGGRGSAGIPGVPSELSCSRTGGLVDIKTGRRVWLPPGLNGNPHPDTSTINKNNNNSRSNSSNSTAAGSVSVPVFDLLRVGLGALGVVTELELRCAPLHSLEEHTHSASIAELRRSMEAYHNGTNRTGTGAGASSVSKSEAKSKQELDQDQELLEPLRAHYRRLRDCRHTRYMWLPHTDVVVQVTSCPVEGAAAALERHNADATFGSTLPMRRLLAEVMKGDQELEQQGIQDNNVNKPAVASANTVNSSVGNRSRISSTKEEEKEEENLNLLESKSFAELRSLLLNHGTGTPGTSSNHMLNPAYVARVNEAEAAYWQSCNTVIDTDSNNKRNNNISNKEDQLQVPSPPRVGYSNDILGFDCGSEQLVLEVCFPMGAITEQAEELSRGDKIKGSGKKCYRDIEFVLRLLELIEQHKIPAPAPIEQRWTCGSSSLLSPAHTDTATTEGEVFCWVGIIMYLPTAKTRAKDATTATAAVTATTSSTMTDTETVDTGATATVAVDDSLALEVEKQELTAAFQRYVETCVYPLLQEFGAVPHWAKIETPRTLFAREKYRACLHREQGRQNESTGTGIGADALSVCATEQLELLREMYPPKEDIGTTIPSEGKPQRVRPKQKEQQQRQYSRPEHAVLCEQLLRRYPVLTSGGSTASSSTSLPSPYLQLLSLLDPQHLLTNELIEELLDLGTTDDADARAGSVDNSNNKNQ